MTNIKSKRAADEEEVVAKKQKTTGRVWRRIEELEQDEIDDYVRTSSETIVHQYQEYIRKQKENEMLELLKSLVRNQDIIVRRLDQLTAVQSRASAIQPVAPHSYIQQSIPTVSVQQEQPEDIKQRLLNPASIYALKLLTELFTVDELTDPNMTLTGRPFNSKAKYPLDPARVERIMEQTWAHFNVVTDKEKHKVRMYLHKSFNKKIWLLRWQSHAQSTQNRSN